MKTPMKLLGDTKYCIKVDYFMWDDEKNEEYREPMYLAIDTEIKDRNGNPANLIMFKENITANLRVFDTKKEAKDYITTHNTGISICYENERVVAIRYNFETREWEEC